MEECFDPNEPEEQPRGARICDILAAAMEKARAGEGETIFVDCSTSRERNVESAANVLTCVTPKHEIYLNLLSRYVKPQEYLNAQGIWRVDAENVQAYDKMLENGLAQELAGNSFTSTVVQAVVLASFVTCECWLHIDLQEMPAKPMVVIEMIRGDIKATGLETTKQQDEELASMSPQRLHKFFQELADNAESLLQPINMDINDGALLNLGNLDKMREEMNQPRGAMDDLLHLTDLPDVDGEDVDGTLVHMRVQELAGETKLCWAIQKGDDSSTRVALPTYISQVLEMRVCSFVSEHSAWETRIEGRFAQGKNLSSRQQKAYDQWKLRCEQQLVFSKQHECLVCDSKDVDERCFSIDLLLREDPEKLKVKASDGSEYRLVLLQSAPSIQPHDDLPSELDLELPEGIAEGMELAEEGSAESGEEAAPDEFAALQEADEQYAHDNLEAEPDADLFALADSDEEICLDEDNITQRR
ncbi:unnamed protein product [Durusdinium trenchii]|uniref:Uncharacterized protein n=1 Tax=Durusdinium trenchii TaxID=1381693 RepID=A0ABP0NSE9_9DINO